MGSSTLLFPGFRFHPTDEELVIYFLKRKVSGKPFRFDAISDVDVYKSEPWDLPDKSRLKSRDLEWYFFSALDRKYGNGWRTNRATEKGYWKTTGKDRPVHHGSSTVGMKKTLVYHLGRPPCGERTNWVMHEYKLVDEMPEKSGSSQVAFVLCRIFQKSGTGPKNGEEYGAPFVEEEWDSDDEVSWFPGGAVVGGLAPSDDVFVEGNDLNQDLGMGDLPGSGPLQLNVSSSERSNNVEDLRDTLQNNGNPLMGAGGNYLGSELPNGQNSYDLPAQADNYNAFTVRGEYFMEQTDRVNPQDVNYLLDEPYLDATDNLAEIDASSHNNEYFPGQRNNVNLVDATYLCKEPYVDATGNLQFDDGLFLETNDLSNPVEADSSGIALLEEYLAHVDAVDNSLNFAALDSSMMGIENPITDQVSLNEELMSVQREEGSVGSHKLLTVQNNDGASTSKQKQEAEGLNSDSKHPFIGHASCMLGSMPAPPAFASELPSEDIILRLKAAAFSSISADVTAGMIRVPDTSVNSFRMNWLFDKKGSLSFILSSILPQLDSSLFSVEPVSSLCSAKMVSVMPLAMLYTIFFLAFLLSVCYRVGTCICAR